MRYNAQPISPTLNRKSQKLDETLQRCSNYRRLLFARLIAFECGRSENRRLQDGHLRLLRQVGGAPQSQWLRGESSRGPEHGRISAEVRRSREAAVMPHRGGEWVCNRRSCPGARDSSPVENRP